MKQSSDQNDTLTLIGAEENNLKNFDLSIKHNQLIVITGVSGSGKSTLALDTIYAEGGRRYIETFSPYTRQFLDRLPQPKLAAITGVRPALALEQRNRTTNSRSTVGTVTEINDYLKVLWANRAELHCPHCCKTIRRDSPQQSSKAILAEATSSEALYLAFPLEISTDVSSDSLIATLSGQGFLRYFNMQTKSAERLEELTLEPQKKKGKKDKQAIELFIVVDRLRTTEFSAEFRDRVLSGIHQAYASGHGKMVAIFVKGEQLSLRRFHEAFVCSDCGFEGAEPRPFMFSFNSPLGACRTCNGFGRVLSISPELCVPNPNKSIREGALVCWDTEATKNELKKLKAFCDEVEIDLDVPWKKLSKKQIDLIFSGSKKAPKFVGVRGWFDKLSKKRHKMHVRVFLSRYRAELECPDCHGTRLIPAAANYLVKERTLPDLWGLSLEDALEFFREIRRGEVRENAVDIALDEVVSRLQYLVEIGLGYLTLDRQTRTLSGGENQRVNLTSILGSRLVNTMLVLDEPTIGLHQSDTFRLIETLRALQEKGNTVFVVEHDAEVIRAADEIVDIGPNSGNAGGAVIFQGPLDKLEGARNSWTGKYLSLPPKKLEKVDSDTSIGEKKLTIRGLTANNLQGFDLEIPLGGLVVLTGVSGSGKSSLLRRCLFEPYAKLKQGLSLSQLLRQSETAITGFEGVHNVSDIILVDQSPIGKTPRSNPATYTKAWDLIRECLADTPEAQKLGLTKSSFSFNVDGGRCPVCSGAGFLRVEMQFLADVFVLCEACNGSRFQDKVLSVRLAGKNVVELLNLSLDEAVVLFRSLGEEERAKRISELIEPLVLLGLGYLRLGHPLSNVSGGEAQRIKIASFLQDTETKGALFIFDEPTTGLHPHNIQQLLQAIRLLIQQGHSVLCVEHNLDVIEHADWLIDLGPGGGIHGGRLVATGSPSKLAFERQRFPESKTAEILAFRQTADFQSQRKSQGKPRAENRIMKNSAPAIEIIGARHHNLKNLSLRVPHNTFTVVTGVSGSGKSTLAFDIIFAEGQRRYIDCLSPYARQYIKQITRADVDRVSSIPPTVAISQKTSPPLGISTIATTTELYQFLRLLYAKVGTQHCPVDNSPITSYSTSLITAEILEQYGSDRVFVLAPVVSGRKGYYNDLFNRALAAEITEARIDGKIVKLHSELRLERHKLHYISLVVGSLTAPKKQPEILHEVVEQALLLGGGTVEIVRGDKSNDPAVFSTARVCPKCKRGYRELDPQDFSFRSARGVCNGCGGRGVVELKGKISQHVKCPDCHGARIGKIGQHVFLDGFSIAEVVNRTAPELLEHLRRIPFAPRLRPIVDPILKELESRLNVICSVGLDYMRLDRDASTISGGEAQRLRLAKTLGSPLTGVCYVLDEPSIGLHPQDQDKLMETLFALRDSGNTVIVVEHDEETIRLADHIIDIGPTGGAGGGTLVVQGSVVDVENSETSVTGSALRARSSGAYSVEMRAPSSPLSAQALELIGAKANNLKDVSVSIPLQELTVVVGVSGAGKSSLVHGSFIPALIEELSGVKKNKKTEQNRTWPQLKNAAGIERLVEIDQSPVGKTITSTPASFLGIFDEIRKIYAATNEAKIRGWATSHFSFNTGKGRCPECSGRGFIKIPMSFLPEATTTCEACNGLRYNEETLELLYQGLSIGELLQKTMFEAREILANHKLIRRSLDYVHELGLGYLTLGQPTYTLSGGEAQRLKIAKELGLREAVNSVYVLDEPTIGLHMADVDKLVRVLRHLIVKGNTVLVIEHNLDVIRAADKIIEIGPGPGDAGGQLLFSGTPQELVHFSGESPTKRFLQGVGAQMNQQLRVHGAR